MKGDFVADFSGFLFIRETTRDRDKVLGNGEVDPRAFRQGRDGIVPKKVTPVSSCS
jgi:hypothetical protein